MRFENEGEMEAAKITSGNFSTIDWENNYFKFCDLEGLSSEGGHITSDFSSCSFKDIDWYWGLFNICNFMECRFTNCTFRGTSFPSCKFVECIFTNCQFCKDNLNTDCDFNSAIAYGCRFENTIGFTAIEVSSSINRADES